MNKQIKRPFLSLIVPIFNEEKRAHNIKRIAGYLNGKKFRSQLVIVNDGSTDASHVLLQALQEEISYDVISYEKNRGKGYAVKKGMLAAKGRYRVFIDVDLSTPLEDIDKLLDSLQKVPVATGSRRLPKSKIIVHQPVVREHMGKLFTMLSQIVLGLTATDFTCGLKGFSEDAADAIFARSTIHRWGFDPEIFFIAKKQGYTVKEVPISWKNDLHTRVKFPQDIIRSFIDLFLIRFNDWRGKYDLYDL